MKPPIPTPEPVPVQTLRKYGLNSTADEVAEVYRQHGELLKALQGVMRFYPAPWEGEDMLGVLINAAQDAQDKAQDAISNAQSILATATQKKG